MIIRRLFLITNIVGIFALCNAQSTKVEDSKGKLLIDLDKIKISDNDFLSSTLFKGIKIIPLETNESCLIGQIHKIRVFDPYILICDLRIGSLFVFGMDGRFIRQIGSIGQGPGEFAQMGDFTIQRFDGEKLHHM